MRITIIGHCASGKSTFARTISEKLHIPRLEIDRLWFQAGGNTVPKSDTVGREKVDSVIDERVQEFVKQDAWVSDGWYRKVQPIIAGRADVIVFLDIPLWRRLFNHIYRVLCTERHAELTKWQDLTFSWQIVTRTYRHGPAMREFVRERGDKVVTLRSYMAVRRYLEGLH